MLSDRSLFFGSSKNINSSNKSANMLYRNDFSSSHSHSSAGKYSSFRKSGRTYEKLNSFELSSNRSKSLFDLSNESNYAPSLRMSSQFIGHRSQSRSLHSNESSSYTFNNSSYSRSRHGINGATFNDSFMPASHSPTPPRYMESPIMSKRYHFGSSSSSTPGISSLTNPRLNSLLTNRSHLTGMKHQYHITSSTFSASHDIYRPRIRERPLLSKISMSRKSRPNLSHSHSSYKSESQSSTSSSIKENGSQTPERKESLTLLSPERKESLNLFMRNRVIKFKEHNFELTPSQRHASINWNLPKTFVNRRIKDRETPIAETPVSERSELIQENEIFETISDNLQEATYEDVKCNDKCEVFPMPAKKMQTDIETNYKISSDKTKLKVKKCRATSEDVKCNKSEVLPLKKKKLKNEIESKDSTSKENIVNKKVKSITEYVKTNKCDAPLPVTSDKTQNEIKVNYKLFKDNIVNKKVNATSEDVKCNKSEVLPLKKKKLQNEIESNDNTLKEITVNKKVKEDLISNKSDVQTPTKKKIQKDVNEVKDDKVNGSDVNKKVKEDLISNKSEVQTPTKKKIQKDVNEIKDDKVNSNDVNKKAKGKAKVPKRVQICKDGSIIIDKLNVHTSTSELVPNPIVSSSADLLVQKPDNKALKSKDRKAKKSGTDELKPPKKKKAKRKDTNEIKDTNTDVQINDVPRDQSKAILGEKLENNVKTEVTKVNFKSKSLQETKKEKENVECDLNEKVDQQISNESEMKQTTHPSYIRTTPKRLRFRKYTADDFSFLKVLGRGSFGKVFLAELREHDAYFAIKCLKKHSVIEDDDVDSIMIERKVLAYGSVHPFICKLFCTFQTEGYLCFAMEWCSGGDLMYHVQKYGKFNEDKARFYAAEILCAVTFMHKKGIVYRDLKLDNIMIEREGHIRLVDFGMCQGKIYREELLPSNFCGTPEYMAPEIIKGVKYNNSVDFWSLGVLLFEMVVGTSPFQGTDEDELLWNVCYEEVKYPRYLSQTIVNFLSLLMIKSPENRLGMPTCKSGDIYCHPFFLGINWEKVEKCQLEPPFVPQLSCEADVRYFDEVFTREEPHMTPIDEEIINSFDQTVFKGFSYTNHNMTD